MSQELSFDPVEVKIKEKDGVVFRRIDKLETVSRGTKGHHSSNNDLNTMKSKIREPVINIKIVPLIRRITGSELDDDYEHILVRHGMNILIPSKSGSMKELRFNITLLPVRPSDRSAYVVDGFPNDDIELIERSLDMEVNLTKAFKFVFPPAAIVGDVLDIRIPFKLDLSYTVLRKGFSEAGSRRVSWYVSEKHDIQEFEYLMIIKKRKDIHPLKADVEALWSFEPRDKSILDKFKGLFGVDKIEFKTETRTIDLIPEMVLN
ncbi:MAG: hypothetical protein ACXAC2_05815 [Candidatus Kariarchaeaceae archaeon]|jgi:hypothetical protein